MYGLYFWHVVAFLFSYKEQGHCFMIHGQERHLWGGLVLWTGDTLGSNCVSGFKEGVGGALRICRHCRGTKEETKQKVGRIYYYYWYFSLFGSPVKVLLSTDKVCYFFSFSLLLNISWCSLEQKNFRQETWTITWEYAQWLKIPIMLLMSLMHCQLLTEWMDLVLWIKWPTLMSANVSLRI